MLELRVIAGDPSAEEIAAVTAVLLMIPGADGGDAADPGTAPVSRWRASAIPGTAGRPGRGAWRASALPVRR